MSCTTADTSTTLLSPFSTPSLKSSKYRIFIWLSLALHFEPRGRSAGVPGASLYRFRFRPEPGCLAPDVYQGGRGRLTCPARVSARIARRSPQRRTAMPIAKLRGVSLNYEITGDTGPFVVLQP